MMKLSGLVRRIRLAEAPKALGDADEGHDRGKVVISVGHSRETQGDEK